MTTGLQLRQIHDRPARSAGKANDIPTIGQPIDCFANRLHEIVAEANVVLKHEGPIQAALEDAFVSEQMAGVTSDFAWQKKTCRRSRISAEEPRAQMVRDIKPGDGFDALDIEPDPVGLGRNMRPPPALSV